MADRIPSTIAEPPGESEPLSEVRTLVDELLEEQQQLRAAERFSRIHDEHHLVTGLYQHLIPLTPPRPGEQFAFQVDLDRCSGCKGCVTACHSLNGLDEDEVWREVGLLVGRGTDSHSSSPSSCGTGDCNCQAPIPTHPPDGIQKTVTTACHHCVEPGCLLGCPVLAYEKDPVTGIVHHLDDQCIGCSYCILKCPYDVPKFSEKRGIVRKCDMCRDRLAGGEAPACVQGCPNEAIQIVKVKSAVIASAYRSESMIFHDQPAFREDRNAWLPDSPNPALTLPTTLYLSSEKHQNLRAVDGDRPRAQPCHWPLVWMLVLTQFGLGGVVAGMWIEGRGGARLFGLSLGLFALGLGASALHLGRPQKAWRAWLGWRTSWLSREVIAMNVCFALAAIGGIQCWNSGQFPGLIWKLLLLVSCAAAIIAQSMVYADTGRWAWRLTSTLPRFLFTSLAGGASLAAVFSHHDLPLSLLAALGLTVATTWVVRMGSAAPSSTTREQRLVDELNSRTFSPQRTFRRLLLFAGTVALPFLIMVLPSAFPLAFLIPFLVFASEIVERWLFFRTAATYRMPGTS